ncbi:MAG: hypothetical protein J2P19_15885 [Pseudonocardia sp.]|nr:hypothetical protein [Pseudonocardia sp.]
MPATMRPADPMTSVELVGLLDQADRLAGAAGRADLSERLARARARVAGRQMRVAVVGAVGQGATSLAHVLEQASADRLPGATFTDAPGRQPADVVLFVHDAGNEYGPPDLDALARIRAQGAPVAGVLTKIDIFSGWDEVQRANRRRLQAANLDSPSIPLLPVSSALCEDGQRRDDESLVVASGVPQLLDFLRDRIATRVDPALRDSVLGDVRVVADQLGRLWNGELDTLRASGGSPLERQQRAVAALERCQALSASWQLALGDGVTELISQVDFDLRERLREVMELAEQSIGNAKPMGHWQEFDTWLRGKIQESVLANFQLARQRSQRLAEQVAGTLAGNPDGSPAGVALPAVRMADPQDALRKITPMQSPDGGGMFARVVNSVRGSYGGVLMVGVLTSLAGLSLISIWSVAAGVLLGVFTFWEDRKNGRERAKAEAKMAVAKLMDHVNFRVGDELRTQLRAVHRTLRDHFTEINDQRLRTASDAVRAASESVQQGDGQHDARMSALQDHLAELRQLRIRTSTPAR